MVQETTTLEDSLNSKGVPPIGASHNTNAKETKHRPGRLEAVVSSGSNLIKGLAASYTNTRKDRILRRFWEQGTSNPHVAHLIYVLAVNEASPQQRGIITAEDAIDVIERDSHKAVIELMRHYTRISKISGGGGLRGTAYCGEQEVFPFLPSDLWVTSVGFLDGLIQGMRRMVHIYGPEAAKGMDLSSSNYYNIATKMAHALGDLVKSNGNDKRHAIDIVNDWAKSLQLYKRGIMGEAFFVKEPLLQVFRSEFPRLKVSDVEGIHIMVTDFGTGELLVLGKDSHYSDMYLDVAYDSTISFPFAFKHSKVDGRMLVDGGLGITPLGLAFSEGADFVYATFLNLFIPKIEDVNATYAQGKIRLANRMYQIWQRDATAYAIRQLTGKSFKFILRNWDPKGRLLLSADDFTDYDTFELGKNGKDQIADLPPKGRAMASRTIDKLDPKYKTPESAYDPRIFILRWEAAKHYGPKFANTL